MKYRKDRKAVIEVPWMDEETGQDVPTRAILSSAGWLAPPRLMRELDWVEGYRSTPDIADSIAYNAQVAAKALGGKVVEMPAPPEYDETVVY